MFWELGEISLEYLTYTLTPWHLTRRYECQRPDEKRECGCLSFPPPVSNLGTLPMYYVTACPPNEY